MKQLQDRFGRVHNALRISVTDKCNLRCHYCMPVTGVKCAPRDQLLTFEQIVQTVQVANRLGVDRIRITGGEPLLRRDLPRLIGMLKRETDSVNVSMTTNALTLEKYAVALAEAGLDRINISLDSLRPDRFEKITRFGVLETVWRGIEAATKAGMTPIKINTLLLEGFNEDEVEDWIQLTMENDISVRFMELMPIGEGVKMAGIGSYLNLTALKDRLVETHGLAPVATEKGNGPARYYAVPGAKGTLGFITPLSNKYCDTCSRMRLTSTGELRACLAHDEHVDISEAIRAGDEAGIEAGFLRAVGNKVAGHNWENGQVTQIGMSKLGG